MNSSKHYQNLRPPRGIWYTTSILAVIGGLVAALGPVPLAAQEIRTFEWEASRTVCYDGQPGSDRGGQQRYLLQDRTSGRKTIHVKVRSGTTEATESESIFASIEFVNVVTHEADPLEVLQFAENNGFQHSAAVLQPLATQRGAPSRDAPCRTAAAST